MSAAPVAASASNSAAAPNNSNATSFVDQLAQAVATHWGHQGREAARQKSGIAKFIEDRWKEWSPKILEYARTGYTNPWFRFRFTHFTYYTPTLEDVVDNLPAELKTLHESGQLIVLKADVGYTDQFEFQFKYKDLATQKYNDMKERGAWPAVRMEDRIESMKRKLEWDDDEARIHKRFQALEGTEWCMKRDKDKKLYYEKKGSGTKRDDWPETQVGKPDPEHTPLDPAKVLEKAKEMAKKEAREEAAAAQRVQEQLQQQRQQVQLAQQQAQQQMQAQVERASQKITAHARANGAVTPPPPAEHTATVKLEPEPVD